MARVVLRLGRKKQERKEQTPRVGAVVVGEALLLDSNHGRQPTTDAGGPVNCRFQ